MRDYTLGNYIYEMRKKRGLSQYQLGQLLGVSDKAVSKWETGSSKPRPDSYPRLAEILGVSVDELFSGESNAESPIYSALDQLKRELWNEAYSRLSIYGDTPPNECWSRLASEESILERSDIIHCLAVVGKIAKEAKRQNLVTFMSGLENSSYAAWLMEATTVNPLPPHYFCPLCGNVEFDSSVADGFDLPTKKCKCGGTFLKDGHDIPHEGYTRVAKDHAHMSVNIPRKFKPVATQIIHDFYNGLARVLPVSFEFDHPEWNYEDYVILPPERKMPTLSDDGYWHPSLEEFYDWHSPTEDPVISLRFHDTLDELQVIQSLTNSTLPDLSDLISHDAIKTLYRKRQKSIPFITDSIDSKETINFDLLVRVDCLSHTEGSWIGNGDKLVKNGEASFRDIPASREDVWRPIVAAMKERNIHEYGFALKVMERARKGLFQQGVPERIRAFLLALGLPEWFPVYLEKVNYLFPKGHGVAFLVVDLLYEWYSINHHEAVEKANKAVM